jgi:GDP-4-dehydro-6-deoxy-D-mannose reductase
VKAVVTGARGFVGRHLTRHLGGLDVDVVSLDVDDTQPVDITDRDAVARRIAEESPDVVYHLAARSHVGASWTDGDALDAVNVGGTRAVIDACVAAGVGRVLVVGSAEQYGTVDPDALPVDEQTECRPLSPYGKSKVAAEAFALEAHRRHGLPVVCTRAFNHTGPGQSPAFLVPGLAARIAAAERADPQAVGADEIALGNGDPVRDFSDVRDVVRAYALLATRGRPGEVYNVCSGRGVRVGDVAARLVARARRPLRVVTATDLVRAVDVPVLVGDPPKLQPATGWQPQHDLDDTLDAVLADARAAHT